MNSELKKRDSSTSTSETSENAYLFHFISPLGVCIYVQCIFDVVKIKIQRRSNVHEKNECYVNVLQVLTNDQYFPKTISQ